MQQEIKLETNESPALGPKQPGELPAKKLIKSRKFSESKEKADTRVNLRLDPLKKASEA